MLFGGKFLSWLIKNFVTKFLFLYEKALLQTIFLHLFFEVQNQNEPIAIKIHHTQDFIHAGKSLTVLAIRCRKKTVCKTNVDFSKQMLHFHLFFSFILRYVKKCAQSLEFYCYYIPYIFSVFIKIFFECYNLLIELVS